MTVFESIWKSIILGTVQGLTEFLPVSSSGHLSLLQRALGFGLGDGSMTFLNVMLHLGTLIAVVWVFRREILSLFRKPFKTLMMLLAATVPAGVFGLLFHDDIDRLFAGERGLALLAVCFAATALGLIVSEYAAKARKRTSPLGWGHAAAMGIIQAAALLPGVSRSGSTIVAGTLSGAKREDVAKFSFLMSIPVILGSFAVELKEAVFSGTAVPPGRAEMIGMLFGILFAAVSGLFSVRVMLRAVGKANYKWFSLYLVLLSLACFWLDVLQIF